MGGTAVRFGLTQGDLHTTEGRSKLFQAVGRHQPRNIWMSPICKPWSGWSQFNSRRSLEGWDKIHAERQENLIQVALCLVLCRYQVRLLRHAHWEQPRGSTMMALRYVQEIFRYMLHAHPDLCTAGELKDPVNQKLMKKGLHIATSSKGLYKELEPLKCKGNHEHQVIEGSTIVHGQNVSRATFSELYPRRFARRVAKVMLKNKFPLEKPCSSLVDPALAIIDAIAAADDRPAKRQRLSSSRSLKTKSADRNLENMASQKKIRKETDTQSNVENPDRPEESQDKLVEVMQLIEPKLPRVGKKQFEEPEILKAIQVIFPEKTIKCVIACKGTERAIGPPSNMNKKEIPYRRAIMKLRSDNQVIAEKEWEKHDMLSQRKTVRKTQPCRINITVFAANPEIASAPKSSSTTQPKAQSTPSRIDGDDTSEVGSNPEAPSTSSSEEKTSQQPENPHEEVKEETCSGPTPILKELPEPTTHGPRFLALPKEEQAMLLRAHKNLCHPSPAQFNAVLKQQGARPELQQAVWDMSCNACAATQKPKIARPSTVKHELDFNDKIFVDGITWNSKNNKTFHFYHIIDQATNYHVAIPAPSRTAENAVRCVSEAWLMWAGAPNMIVTDSATEFLSETFGEFLQRHDIKPVTTAPYAHWQNGRCERHGDILQSMLTKVDLEHPIETYDELQQALLQCTGAKNKLSIRRGYSPEVLVFGKCAKLPGSLSSSEGESSLASADREDALGIAFRKSLALRERARIAFHQADNDMALRRACLRRSRPLRDAYEPGEWVMMWQPTAMGGHWFGPLKVVTQENQYSVWATQGGKIHRRAPEHIRPVCSSEARSIPTNTEAVDVQSKITPSNNQVNPDDDNPITNNPHNPSNINDSQQSENQSLSQEQPDDEPEAMTPQDSQNPSETHDPAVETPVPELGEDPDGFITTHLLCCEDEVLAVDTTETPCAWRCELDAPSHLCHETFLTQNADEILLATTEKKQRTEVKLSMLSEDEKVAFQKAKETEVNNWLKTGTVSKILRDKLAPEQILRCRWILVWKPLEGGEHQDSKASKLLTHKPKARLVVLGYMDPKLTEVPRDSPTLGRQSKMLILQLIASMGWSLGSFDIKAAFLQGRPQRDRIIGLEPVVELAKAMNLSSNEICRLDKSAYGLIDAPYLWFKTLHDELTSLGFFSSPFDPCVYLLKNPKTKELSGVLGIHVDDGIHGGDNYFHQQISKLEQKYPFGSKKSRTFTFTGIDLQQNTDNSIELSQSKYVKNINPITMTAERRADENAPVTEKERHLLRGLIGSLQYAAVHTRPDLASSLSFLQSDINKATVSTNCSQ